MCHHASMITFVLILCDLIFLSGSNFLWGVYCKSGKSWSGGQV